MLFHPSSSPDLAPADFFIFQMLIKGMRFEAVSLIQQIVARELKTIREEAFSRAFDSMYERCKRCAEAGRTL
jgi:hypothetical protein